MRPSFFHHLHPPTIPAAQARWRYTLGAGGLAIFLVLILIVTGTLELFFYVPTPDGAAQSVQTLTFLVPFGDIVRGLHYWAAQALVAIALLHLLRVIFTGAYGPPRRFNYLIGVALLILVILLDFSGYVLRWDEGIRWALVAGTNLLKSIPALGQGLYGMIVGGNRPGPATLLRFYAWHVFGLTLLLVVIGIWHIFRVRRDGGISAPPRLKGEERYGGNARLSRDELVKREALAALLALIFLLLVAAFLPAPIARPIPVGTSLGSETEAHAPWFFRWIQQLLRWGDPFWMGVALPALALAGIAVIPFALPSPHADELGRWFPRSGRAVQLLVAVAAVAVLLLTLRESLP